jgi:hypothetical protein
MFIIFVFESEIEISISDLRLEMAGDARASLYARVEDPQSELMSIGWERGVV